MRKVIDVFDVFEVENRGLVVAGVNHALDTLAPDQIRDFIGKEVEIHSANGVKAKYSVLDVQTTNSIINQKNIFILLPLNAKSEDIKLGAVIYSPAEDRLQRS